MTLFTSRRPSSFPHVEEALGALKHMFDSSGSWDVANERFQSSKLADHREGFGDKSEAEGNAISA